MYNYHLLVCTICKQNKHAFTIFKICRFAPVSCTKKCRKQIESDDHISFPKHIEVLFMYSSHKHEMAIVNRNALIILYQSNDM